MSIFKEELRSLSKEQRDRFRELSDSLKTGIRNYINISGDSLAPFVGQTLDPYGVGIENYAISEAPNDLYLTPPLELNQQSTYGNYFSENGSFDFAFLKKTQGDTFWLSQDFEYEVVRGSGSRNGYLIYQLDDQGRGQFPRDLLAVVAGNNDQLRSLSASSGPLSAADFLS